MSAGRRSSRRIHCLGCHEDFYSFARWVRHRNRAPHGDQGAAFK